MARRRWGIGVDPRTGARGVRLIRDPVTGDVYMRRWCLLTTPWFEIKLHHIRRPDGSRDLHDHPWPFLAFVLRGWYVEELPCKGTPMTCLGVDDWQGDDHVTECQNPRSRRVRRFRFNLKRAGSLHRISEVPPAGAWTLFMCGRRSREWGFLSADGWRSWRAYLGIETAEED